MCVDVSPPETSMVFEKLCYTVKEFEAATGYSHRKTYEAIGRGELRVFKEGKRTLISAEAAREFIRAREQHGSQAA
jgi:hypothetical protein